MGSRGPQPKPTALRIAQGNPGRRELNELEPVPPPGRISPPAFVTGVALQIWNEVSPVMIAMRTLTTADVYPFGRYCCAFARYLELRDAMWAKGWTGTTYPLKSDSGKARGVCELPQAAELRRLHEILSRAEDRFGLSPSARTRLRVEQSPPVATPDGPIPSTFRIVGKYHRQPRPDNQAEQLPRGVPPSPDIPF